MDVTSETAEREELFRDIAKRSIRASYSLSPEQISSILETEFSDEAIADLRDDDDAIAILAEDDGEAVGFVTGLLVDDDAEIDWLFVTPEARGRGIGTHLFEAGRDALVERGAETVRAVVMVSNQEGEMFFEQFGYDRIGRRTLDIGGEEFVAHVYGPEADGDSLDDERHAPETVETDEGTRYTGDEELSGTEAPFLAVYSDEERSDQYGFLCTQCGTLANAANGLDRLQCETCGNESRPDEWDDGYL